MFDLVLASNLGKSSSFIMFIWIAVFVILMYFLFMKPQNKERKRMQDMMANMEVGDYVVTTSGFYGEIINITDEDVVVEFGNNRNCRIPMKKAAIAEIEKAGSAVVTAEPKETKKEDAEEK